MKPQNLKSVFVDPDMGDKSKGCEAKRGHNRGRKKNRNEVSTTKRNAFTRAVMSKIDFDSVSAMKCRWRG